MPRTYDVMVWMAVEAKPALQADLINEATGKPNPTKLVPVLDKHFPIEGGWGTKPLHQGEELLRRRIELDQAHPAA